MMKMATCSNTLQSPEGDPIVGSLIEIHLIWNRREQRVPTDNANNVMILGTYAAYTDSNGEWSVDLTPNDDITPDDSVYRVIERVPPGKQAFTYYISVPSGATPDYWVGDLLVDAPSYVQ
jgi:hypothetical protein